MASASQVSLSDLRTFISENTVTLPDGRPVELRDLLDSEVREKVREAFLSAQKPQSSGVKGERRRNMATMIVVSDGVLVAHATCENTKLAKADALIPLEIEAELAGAEDYKILTFVESAGGVSCSDFDSAADLLRAFGVEL